MAHEDRNEDGTHVTDDKPTITYEDPRICKASDLEQGDLIEVKRSDDRPWHVIVIEVDHMPPRPTSLSDSKISDLIVRALSTGGWDTHNIYLHSTDDVTVHGYAWPIPRRS